MTRHFRLSAAALLLALCVLPAGAQVVTGTTTFPTPNGGWTQFLTATCGSNCADPTGEQSVDQQNWNALVSLGTTQYLGGTYNGIVIDPSSLIAASRVMGAAQLDTWMRTGVAASDDVAQQMATALTAGNGYDVSYVTGDLGNSATPAADSSLANGSSGYAGSVGYAGAASNGASPIDNIAQGIFSDGSNFNSSPGSGSQLCSASVSSSQNAQAQSYVNNMMTIITGASGVSQLGGGTVAAAQASPSGVFGSSCLQNLMSGSRDTLFKPPGLGGLISQLGSMFGGGGGGGGSGGGCGNATPPMQQVMQSMPTGIFFNGGGFFPSTGFTGGEGTNSVFPIPQTGATAGLQGGIAGLYSMR